MMTTKTPCQLAGVARTIKTVAYGPRMAVAAGSDVKDLFWSDGALAITISCAHVDAQRVSGLRIHFEHIDGMRHLDEEDLVRYWGSDGFLRGYHVLEVIDEGWASEEGLLQGQRRPRREWLIVTGNSCVSVFAETPPQISGDSWEID